MHIDIVYLVRQALLESGCDELMLGDFDGHSTISLDFEDRPSLLISSVEGNIWVWSQLGEDLGNLLQYKAGALLEKMMEGCSFSMTGQLQLSSNAGFIELRGMLHPDSLASGSHLAEALNAFFAQQEDYLRIIR